MSDEIANAHEETRAAWNANAQVWDQKMGDDGNDFFRILEWPAILRMLNVQPGQRILDAACGNGLTSRKLAALGADVTAFDFSTNLIELARRRAASSRLAYHIIDATDEQALLALGGTPFNSALCNMALFDMAEIAPLFRAISKMLRAGGAFVFSLTHPAFNNASGVHVAEETDDAGTIETIYSVKISRYMTPYQARGLALLDQPKPQVYFERPLQYYLQLGFEHGFVLDGFEERAFPAGGPRTNPLAWGGQFSEIPPVLVARLRLR